LRDKRLEEEAKCNRELQNFQVNNKPSISDLKKALDEISAQEGECCDGF